MFWSYFPPVIAVLLQVALHDLFSKYSSGLFVLKQELVDLL